MARRYAPPIPQSPTSPNAHCTVRCGQTVDRFRNSLTERENMKNAVDICRYQRKVPVIQCVGMPTPYMGVPK